MGEDLGLTVDEVSAEQQKEWRAEAERFAAATKDGRVPPEILQAVENAVAEYRKGPGAAN